MINDIQLQKVLEVFISLETSINELRKSLDETRLVLSEALKAEDDENENEENDEDESDEDDEEEEETPPAGPAGSTIIDLDKLRGLSLSSLGKVG
mgnify:FL=1